MVKLFWGRPPNPGHMEFHTGTSFSKMHPEGRRHLTSHEIIGLYGFQIGKRFVGIISLGRWGTSIDATQQSGGPDA